MNKKQKPQCFENLENYSEKNSPQKETFQTVRRGSDRLFMFLTIFICFYGLIVMIEAPQLNKYLNTIGISFNLSIWLWLGPGILLSYLLYFPFGNYLEKYWIGFLKNEGFRENETPEERVRRTNGYLIGFIYYFISFSFTFLIASKKNYLPRVYGGNLNLFELQKAWPLEVDWMIKTVYIISFGHHLERLIVHAIFNYKSSTYYTMLSHHVTTVGLIMVSMPTNYYHFGIPVLLLLDLSDSILHLGRFFRETDFKLATKICFIFMALSWLHGRVLGFFAEIIYFLILFIMFPYEFLNKFWTTHLFFFMGLILLGILNVFWFCQIIKTFVTLIIKSNEQIDYEDTYMKKRKT